MAEPATAAGPARWDGVLPGQMEDGEFGMLTPEELEELVSYVRAHRIDLAPFDVVLGGRTTGGSSADATIVAFYVDAGLTWWVEGIDPWEDSANDARDRIRRGPPRL